MRIPLLSFVLFGLLSECSSQLLEGCQFVVELQTPDRSNCCNMMQQQNYCDLTSLTLEHKRRVCGHVCGLCGGPRFTTYKGVNGHCAFVECPGNICPTTTTRPPTTTSTTTTARPVLPGEDANPNCAALSADATNPYCASTSIPVATKTAQCAKTCAFEIKPNAHCALYTLTGTTLTRGTPSNKTEAPDYVPTGAVDGKTTVSRVFVAPNCVATLYKDAKPDDAVHGFEELIGPGTASASFFAVSAGAKALSYTCTCW